MTVGLRDLFLLITLLVGAVWAPASLAQTEASSSQPVAAAPPPAAIRPAPATQPAPPAPPVAAQAPPPASATAPVAQPPQFADAGGHIPIPPAGKGQVVFFRPWAYPGMLVSFSVHEGATGIGKLGTSTYFIYVGDPGPHTFTTQSEATDTLHMEIDAGETYYVKETLGMGIVLYRPELTPSDEASFDKLNPKLSTQKPTDLKTADAKDATG